MFHRRLKWFVVILFVLAVVVIGRLIDLQVLSASEYEALADRLLTRPVRYLRAPRGDIRDRTGQTLVRDAPASDINVHYRALAGRNDYLYALARRLRERGQVAADRPIRDVVDELKLRISEDWSRLAELTGVPVAELVERAEAIVQRVQRIRRVQQERSGLVQPIREENAFHALIEAVDEATALSVRLAFNEIEHPWFAVVPGSQRVADDADTLAHVLGRLGSASRERIAADSLRDDDLRALRPGDLCGVSGVEYAAEATLRGARGYVIEDFDHTVIERVDPTPGQPVHLTLDAALQRRVYDIVKKAVDESEHPCGGAAVVLDAASREILALVSYPVYSLERYAQEFAALQADARWLPHRFRAVAGSYPPGSTCKVATLVAGLSEKVITPQTRLHCSGHFLPDQPGIFRCWIYNQHLTTHDQAGYPGGLNADDAIKNSCNIYFFNVGQRLGAQRLCEWFLRFGLGRPQGTGLIEEASGIVPTAAYLRERGREHEPSDAWNFSIGQGEVTATPLQSANVAASIAMGRVAPVRLFLPPHGLDDAESGPHAALDESAVSVVRAGMYAVVNEVRGTAYRYARLATPGYVLCGKTGSAQASPRVLTWRYTYEWPDGEQQSFVAATEAQARAQLLAGHPERDPDRATANAGIDSIQTAAKRPRLVGRRVADRYPPVAADGKLPSHAWFIGFTQSADTPRGAEPRGRVYAISVLIEYGGSGGHVAAPAAKSIAEAALALPPPSDGPALGWNR